MFRSTVFQLYYCDKSDQNITHTVLDLMIDTTSNPAQVLSPVPESILLPLPRKRDRPKGLKNKTKNQDTFFSQKEKDNIHLAIKLRNNKVITTLKVSFQEFNQKKVSDLVDCGVFKFELFNKNNYDGIQLFKSYIVYKVKGKNDKPYEKSRFIIQGYHDNNKESILIQSLTIQQISQKIILALTPLLIKHHGIFLNLRNIIQAYPQSYSDLFHTILATLSSEITDYYPCGTIIRVVKSLYGFAKAGVH